MGRRKGGGKKEREKGREGGRERGREGGRKGEEREGKRERGWEGGISREEEREGGREGGREGMRDMHSMYMYYNSYGHMCYISLGALALDGDFFGHAYLIPSWTVKYTCSVNSNSTRSCWLQPDKLVSQCSHVGVVCKGKYMYTCMYIYTCTCTLPDVEAQLLGLVAVPVNLQSNTIYMNNHIHVHAVLLTREKRKYHMLLNKINIFNSLSGLEKYYT